ncbi:uncharacterized protein EI90DRAFT_3118342 [Cantharellus anzutake]|uniref:uncharacterized protein n=1 Tax=Cantharellus anzutake TaxID=1750568 RepID=UPI001905FAFD|nr:uncharacterized protein EI90DRAFT_3118342 [Cantharellus anzutake]KAF8337905.1 hypothetical protein EI90DRAFT_3118342 [Cantharellus anzutake]
MTGPVKTVPLPTMCQDDISLCGLYAQNALDNFLQPRISRVKDLLSSQFHLHLFAFVQVLNHHLVNTSTSVNDVIEQTLSLLVPSAMPSPPVSSASLASPAPYSPPEPTPFPSLKGPRAMAPNDAIPKMAKLKLDLHKNTTNGEGILGYFPQITPEEKALKTKQQFEVLHESGALCTVKT